jgi:hypothetical protein
MLKRLKVLKLPLLETLLKTVTIDKNRVISLHKVSSFPDRQTENFGVIICIG